MSIREKSRRILGCNQRAIICFCAVQHLLICCLVFLLHFLIACLLKREQSCCLGDTVFRLSDGSLKLVLSSLVPQLSWTLVMSCPLAQCLREPSSAALRRSPVTEASWPVLQETTPQSSPTTPRPRSPESSCPQAPRRSSPLPTEPSLVRKRNETAAHLI